MKKGDVIRQKCVNTTFYLTGILAHKVNNVIYATRYARGVKSCYFTLIRYVTRYYVSQVQYNNLAVLDPF